MGWGIDFNFDLYIHKPESGLEDNIEAVKDKIEELKKEINDLKTRIKMYAIANPETLVDDEWKDDKVTKIDFELNGTLNWYDDNMQKLILWEYYLQYLENKQNNNKN